MSETNDEITNHTEAKKIINDATTKAYETFHCALCSKLVTRKDVVGQFQCSYHPLSYSGYDDMFLCCGKKRDSFGCRACDHTPNPYADDGYVSVLYEMYSKNIYKKPNKKYQDMSKSKLFLKDGLYYVRVKVAQE